MHDSGVDQLIKKVRTEALDKVAEERERVLKATEEKAQAIIAQAKKEASDIINDAKAFSDRERTKLRSELELAARDFSISLCERLKEQMFFPAIKKGVRATLKEPDFLKEVLKRLVVEFIKDNPSSLDVLVPKELKTTLSAFFASAIFDDLDGESDIRLVDEEGIEGFALIKRGEHYVWDFRTETISRELIRLIEPSLRKYFVAQAQKPLVEPAKPAMV